MTAGGARAEGAAPDGGPGGLARGAGGNEGPGAAAGGAGNAVLTAGRPERRARGRAGRGDSGVYHRVR